MPWDHQIWNGLGWKGLKAQPVPPLPRTGIPSMIPGSPSPIQYKILWNGPGRGPGLSLPQRYPDNPKQPNGIFVLPQRRHFHSSLKFQRSFGCALFTPLHVCHESFMSSSLGFQGRFLQPGVKYSRLGFMEWYENGSVQPMVLSLETAFLMGLSLGE